MSNFKFSPDLFLEVAELNRFKQFLDIDGFRKELLQNTVSFGLIKNKKDAFFSNGRVERDLDTSTNLKTVKIRAINAINSRGLFLFSDEINSIPVPADGKWYWVKVSHAYSSIEKGKVALSINGDLTGSGTKFTEVLRGYPNFPARIKFINSTHNILEYDVLQVIDDEHAIVMHPANNGTGIATFDVESNLQYAVVGTFTANSAVDPANKFPFQYDSLIYSLIEETTLNTRPAYIQNEEFYLARVQISGADVVIQDKRLDYWETKGSELHLDIEVKQNPLIGVESVKWQNLLSPSDENQVYIAWGMRTQNWTVDTSKNIVTFFGSAVGGRFKDISNFTDGDFNGWRVYNAKSGTYNTVVSSIKQGQAINLTLETLDVDNFSDDGGLTLRNQGAEADWLIVTPNAEEIEIICRPGSDNTNENCTRTFTFLINEMIGRCDLQVFLNPSVTYNIKYRYKTNGTYTAEYLLPEDQVGYYSEKSFDSQGFLKPALEDRFLIAYGPSETVGYITLNLSPNAYSVLIDMIYKGDKIGVQTLTDLTNIQLYELKVGRDKRYQFITGNVTLSDDIYINLSDDKAVEGNEFRIHFNCTSLNLNGKKIYIVRNYTTSLTILKTIEQVDVYHMQNQDNGIVFDCIFSDLGVWSVCYQNYAAAAIPELKIIDGVLGNLFDTSGLGKTKGLFGYAVCDGRNGTADLTDRFLLGSGVGFPPQSTGGSNQDQTVMISVANLPEHDHLIVGGGDNFGDQSGTYLAQGHSTGGNLGYGLVGSNGAPGWGKTSKAGGNATPTPITITKRSAYYAVIYAKRLY